MTINEIGLPQWLSRQRIHLQCRRYRRHGFDPWVGKIPWRSKQQPIPIFLHEKSHGQRSLDGYSPKGHKESDMTEQLSMHMSGIEPLKVVNHYIVHLLLT